MKSHPHAASRSAAEVVTQLPVPAGLGLLRYWRQATRLRNRLSLLGTLTRRTSNAFAVQLDGIEQTQGRLLFDRPLPIAEPIQRLQRYPGRSNRPVTRCE